MNEHFAASEGSDDRRLNFFSGASVFLVSSIVIAMQIVLMRALSYSRYHHFSYLVISIALLGFGASGTFLTFLSSRLREKRELFVPVFLILFLISIPVAYYISEGLNIDIQYVFFSKDQLLRFALYIILLFIPFFMGAVIIGGSFIIFRKDIASVYGVNLLGSGAGGITAIGLLYLFLASDLIFLAPAVVLLVLMLWLLSAEEYRGSRLRAFAVSALVMGAALTILVTQLKPSVNIDQYKTGAYLRRLEAQGDANRLFTAFSPRGRVEVYSSDMLHRTMFAGLFTSALPPEQLAVVVDGNDAGTIFRISSETEAGIMELTPQALPYRVIRSPKVLLLGEIGGPNIWLA
ncbi:MAG: hypothetical protein JSV21_02360, partial [Nitrospirota bacterium]